MRVSVNHTGETTSLPAVDSAWDPVSLKDEVARDMGQAMRASISARPSGPPRRSHAPARAPAARGGRSRTGLIGAGVALALVGIAVGALLPKLNMPLPSPEPSAIARAMTIIPMEAPEPVDGQNMGGFETASAPAAPVSEPLLTPTPVAEQPAAPPPARPPAAAPATPAAARALEAAPAIPAPIEREVARPQPVRAPPPPPVDVARPQPFFSERQVARAAEPGRAEVLAADRNLRRAWAEAAQAGAERGLLLEYRRRWERLNRESSHDTNHLVRSYRQMADELDNATFFSDDAVG